VIRVPLTLAAVALAFAFAAALPAYAQTAPPSAAGTPAPSATPAAALAPASTPPLIPTFPPALGATPAPVYNYIYRPSPGAGATPFPIPGTPEILEIDVTDQTLAAPGPLHARIVTNDVVVSVVAQAYGYELDVPKTGHGIFTFDGIIPIVPDAAKGKRFDVDVVATTKDGRTATVTLSFMLK
jgi:hypothetical protein